MILNFLFVNISAREEDNLACVFSSSFNPNNAGLYMCQQIL